ncbi:hypothetical protein IV498_06320 [Paenarthrobacter sp. Z7-10]|uniref:hypothetical protein n=1 Tax=Paenarthrobacter sp. Z7-10 TaxID=2787635 RepID=UPI0022A90771|nr:hypothetical protein [Paenarthrobacter sp. Z7-10]MCZ2402809.1 hypothetical protein [Paenarthrobacter sp. Z7-10]
MVENDVKADLNSLIGTGLGMAQEQLENHGSFLPTALVVTGDGEIRMVGVAPAQTDGVQDPGLDADAMIADLYEVLRQQKGSHRAAAVVCDIHLPDDATDAIHVLSEHRGGVVIAAVQPYSEADGSWTFSDPIWETETPQIWP